MKTKKITGKAVGDIAPVVGGAIVGAMVGRGITAVVSKPADENAPTKAESNKKMIVQGLMVVAGVIGYAVIDGNDAMAGAVKGTALGIAVDNGLQLVHGMTSQSETLKTKLVKDNSVNRFTKAALGLNCPTQGNYTLNHPSRRRMLNYPVMTAEPLLNQGGGFFD